VFCVNILICDDERDIVAALEIYLRAEGYGTFVAYNGRQALEIIASEEVHLVLLDIMMPVMDGMTAMTELRKNSNIPVILLTAKSEETDMVLGLNLGADDYITKPFRPVELLARVRSQLRRYTQLGGASPDKTEDDSRLMVGGIALDDKQKVVTVDGEEVALTPTEYDILHFLMQHPGEVFSPKELYRRVWGDDPFGAENTVAVHIRHLREKLEINPSEPRWLKVVWGQGYKMEKPPAAKKGDHGA
jgi:DNA-binding response OmpR family regulator